MWITWNEDTSVNSPHCVYVHLTLEIRKPQCIFWPNGTWIRYVHVHAATGTKAVIIILWNSHPKGFVLLKFTSMGKFHTKCLFGPPLLVVCVMPSDRPCMCINTKKYAPRTCMLHARTWHDMYIVMIFGLLASWLTDTISQSWPYE